MALYTAHEKDTKYYPKKIVMFVIPNELVNTIIPTIINKSPHIIFL